MLKSQPQAPFSPPLGNSDLDPFNADGSGMVFPNIPKPEKEFRSSKPEDVQDFIVTGFKQ